MTKDFSQICIEYAESSGGGMPLTAEEFCNAVYLYCEERLDALEKRVEALEQKGE